MWTYPKRYDVLVVGGGHAGIEAALAAARLGCQTLLITANLDSIGQMSCNPSIGGLGKGHMVREIDALGGEMAKTTDFSGIQFRMLNTGKGAAVQGPRAQCDKKAYQFRMKWVCETAWNLDLIQAMVTGLCVDGACVSGVLCGTGVKYESKTVIITTGTFLCGLMHVGDVKTEGGRSGDVASIDLSGCLRQLGFDLGRLKTGTSPRVLKRSIDWDNLQIQDGDNPPPFFSHWPNDVFHVEQQDSEKNTSNARLVYNSRESVLSRIGSQIPCRISQTTNKTIDVVRDNICKSPMYSGSIEGTGPRYCPSIEDKVMRFGDKERHSVFLEPEGVTTDEIYVNGMSTSLPLDVQVQLVRSVVGCEMAHVMRPGYAVEYDYVIPTQLHRSLETKLLTNLFLAGQINGTSGYEEAAAQGLMAGVNAARRAMSLSPIVLHRYQAYIGVMIDDLVTRGAEEPYRVFTSRAEYRLLLRQDNADLRLSRIGFELGLLPKEHFSEVQIKAEAIARELARLAATRHGSLTLAQILRRSEVRYQDLPSRDDSLSAEVTKQIEVEVKYSGYLARQETEIEMMRSREVMLIPSFIDYGAIQNLRLEARQNLSKALPSTLGEAARIPGVSPADVSALMIWLRRGV
jgi:tRNA uridine 5-carboxymethylaminomethyl modification enzyme